jgi:acetyl-CoA acetyltransferase
VEKMSSRAGAGRPLTSDGMALEGEQGFTPPAYYAMAARRHMQTYGTTREQIASVAVKNRAAAQYNPKAQYRDPITVDDVLGSKGVVWPLHLLDCCPTGDGAAAAVLVNEAGAERLGLQPTVRVAASVIGSGYYQQQDRDMTSFSLDKSTSARAYQLAELGPSDIDVAEVHDSFSVAEIIHYEDLGFCEPGSGGNLVEAGETALGGRIPVNTGGGLLNRGCSTGATRWVRPASRRSSSCAISSPAVRENVRSPTPEPRWRTSPVVSTRGTSPPRASRFWQCGRATDD